MEENINNLLLQQSWKRTFALFYSGQVFSIIGSSAVQFAMIWWLTAKTESALVLSAAGLVGLLPQALLGPFAGVVVDRFKRKTIMMAADTFIALCSAVLALYFLMGEPPIWFMMVILFVRALGSVFHGPAMQAAIPLFVPPEALMKAGGWGQLVQSGSYLIGPVLGAMLMAAAPMEGVILVDIVGAVIAVGILFFIRITELPPRLTKPHVLREMKEGLVVIRANKPLVAVTLPILFCTLFLMPVSSLYPLIVRSHFNGGAWHASATEVTFALGMMASAFLIGMFGEMKRPFLMISASMAALGATVGISGILPSSGTGFVIFAVLCFFMGGTGNLFSIPYMAYIQRTVPPEAMGRVISLVVSLMTLASPLGLAAAGPGAEFMGVDNWFLISGAGMLLIGIYCYFATRRYDRECEVAAGPGPGEAESVKAEAGTENVGAEDRRS